MDNHERDTQRAHGNNSSNLELKQSSDDGSNVISLWLEKLSTEKKRIERTFEDTTKLLSEICAGLLDYYKNLSASQNNRQRMQQTIDCQNVENFWETIHRQRIVLCQSFQEEREANITPNVESYEASIKRLEENEVFGETIVFEPPEFEDFKELVNICSFKLPAFGKYCFLDGVALENVIAGSLASFHLCAVDKLRRPCVFENNHIEIQIRNNHKTIPFTISKQDMGRWQISCTPKFPGQLRVQVEIDSEPIEQPVIISRVDRPLLMRDFKYFKLVRCIQAHDSVDLDLGKIWGISISTAGTILLPDRHSHCVQMLDTKMALIKRIGKFGTENGAFNRPTSAKFDCRGRIVVSDKDNHRIQIFLEDGTFCLAFGTYGQQPGCFIYPWDIACNQYENIAVSDSGNARIQIFNLEGTLLNIISGNRLTNPRGLCFHIDGLSLIVTDFNRSTLLLIKKTFTSYAIRCCSIYMDKPHQVCIDNQGRALIADSNHKQIEVFDFHSERKTEFFLPPGEDMSPVGVAYSPNGSVFVTDCKLQKIMIFSVNRAYL